MMDFANVTWPAENSTRWKEMAAVPHTTLQGCGVELNRDLRKEKQM